MITYKKYEMESAMIKMIRQCNEDALYWAYRLSEVKGGNKRIWDRLEIMSAEDIGMAYPWLRTYLNIQHQTFLSIEDKKTQQVVVLHTVWFFTKQYKSRLCDNIAHAYFKDQIPKVQFDDIAHLLDLFQDSVNNNEVDQALKYAANLYDLKKENVIIKVLKFPEDPESSMLIKYFTTQNSAQRNYHDLLFLINLILYRTMDISRIKILFEVPSLNIEDVYQDNRQLEVPDCAYDYHCTIGKNLGRGFKHYYEEAAQLNQCFIEDIYEPLAKRINVKKDKS